MNETDLAIVGDKPAGSSVAIEAARAEVKTTLIDEIERSDDQLIKRIHKFFNPKYQYTATRVLDICTNLLKGVNGCGVDVKLNSVTEGIFPNLTLGVIQGNQNKLLKIDRILTSTGAGENKLVFSSWELAGVMGTGTIRKMVKTHQISPRNRVLEAGSKNIELIVTFQLHQAVAEVVYFLKTAPKLIGNALHTSKFRQRWLPIYKSNIIKAAQRKDKIEQSVLAAPDEKWKPVLGTDREINVDVVCLPCGFSLLNKLSMINGQPPEIPIAELNLSRVKQQ